MKPVELNENPFFRPKIKGERGHAIKACVLDFQENKGSLNWPTISNPCRQFRVE